MTDMILLILATCCDSFFMSAAYGIERIRIPLKSVCVIAFCGTLLLGISVILAGSLSQLLTPAFGKWLSFAILCALGVSHLFQAQLKHYVNRHKQQPLIIRLKGVSFVIDIFLDETRADQDHSKEISGKEAAYLGVALSLDSLASGLAYGIGSINIPLLLILSFVIGVAVILAGSLLGRRWLRHIHGDVSWISGCLLLVLALLRLRS